MENNLYEALKSKLEKDFKYERILAGFSNDKKYKITYSNEVMLLRVSDIQLYEKRQNEFNIMKLLLKIGVKCNEPIFFDKIEESNICYSLFSFIIGTDAEKTLAEYPGNIQYKIGIDAGLDLKKINSIKSNASTWKERKIRKHNNYLSEYNKLDYSFPHDKDVESFINDNLDCISCSSDYLQHDDFHPGNIIVNNHSYSGIIDFNRIDWGDPVHDLLKIGWFGKPVSLDYAKGQIDGYFGNEILHKSLWMKYSVYLAMSIYSTIVWHFKYFPHLMGNVEKLINEILLDHNNFKNVKPAWRFGN